MARPLSEVLKDPDVLAELKRDPEGFRFKEAPLAVLTMVPYAPHNVFNVDDFKGVPMNFNFEGPMFHIVEILSSTLNFTYKQVVPPDVSWGSIAPDGNWSGMVGQVFRKEVDMGVTPFTMIQSRFQAVDMSVPFFFDTLAMLVARGSASIDPWGFVLPLTPLVWGLFLAAFLIICVVHFLFECRHYPSSKWLYRIGSIMFEYIQPPFDHAFDRTYWPGWQKPLMGSWILLSLLMNSSYGGNLKSMMALRHIPHPIQTLRDLIDDPTQGIIIEHRSSYIATVKRVPFGDIKEMNEVGVAGRYVDLRMKDFLSHEHLLRRGDHVQIFDTMISLYFRAKLFSDTGRCDFYLAKETFIPFMYTMINQKHSPLTPAIDARIRRIIEAGLYVHWTSNSIANVTACASPQMTVTKNEAIGIGNIWGVAVIWSGGVLLAGVAFILEMIYGHFFNNSDVSM